MFNPAIIKKKKSALMEMEDSKSMKAGKENSEYALKSLAPEMEEEEEKKPKGTGAEAKIEIELMLSGAKKKKGA